MELMKLKNKLEVKDKELLEKANLEEAHAKLRGDFKALHKSYEEEHEHNIIVEMLFRKCMVVFGKQRGVWIG